MNIGIIIAVILGLLVLSVVITGIIQKREQIAAQKRQRAAQYYYRAQNAQDMIELMRAIPVPSEIIQFLMSLSVQSLKTARSIWPEQLNISREIEKAELRLQGYKPRANSRIPLPKDEQSLTLTTAHLKKFMHYLSALKNASVLPENHFNQWNKKLYEDLARIDIEGLLKLATRAVENSKPGTAKSFLALAKSKIDFYSIDPAYKNEQLQLLLNLEQQIQTDKEQQTNKLEQESAVQLDHSDDIFNKKKKW